MFQPMGFHLSPLEHGPSEVECLASQTQSLGLFYKPLSSRKAWDCPVRSSTTSHSWAPRCTSCTPAGWPPSTVSSPSLRPSGHGRQKYSRRQSRNELSVLRKDHKVQVGPSAVDSERAGGLLRGGLSGVQKKESEL